MASVTVQLDEELLRRARELAAARQMTVEQMLERLLRVVTEAPSNERSPITRSATGILKGLPDQPYDELLTEALMEKYGLGRR